MLDGRLMAIVSTITGFDEKILYVVMFSVLK
jgi:hypothetical protein